MSAESKQIRLSLIDILKRLKESPKYAYLFKENLYSVYANEIRGSHIMDFINEFPDLLKDSVGQDSDESYFIYTINFVSQSITDDGAFHKVRIYIDCTGDILRELDSRG
jgi:hypothetical protein